MTNLNQILKDIIDAKDDFEAIAAYLSKLDKSNYEAGQSKLDKVIKDLNLLLDDRS